MDLKYSVPNGSSSTAPLGPPEEPLKQYEVFRPSSWHPSEKEIRQNGQPILLAKRNRHIFKKPEIRISHPQGNILAAVKLQNFTRNQLLYLGSDPENADKSAWTTLDCSGFTASKYIFPCNGESYAWTRTHNSELGASRWNNNNFKLVDQGSGQVLAVYRYNSALFKNGRMADIDYYAQLEQQLELMSLVAILGIELQLEMNRQSGAAAGGAAGAGA